MSTDGAGEAEVWMTVKATGVNTVTAALAGGGSVSATVRGVSSALSISLLHPTVWAVKTLSTSFPLTARVLSNGGVVTGRTVNFEVLLGTGTLSAANVVTGANGEASSTLTVASLATDARVSACVMPNYTPCANFTVHPVEPGTLQVGKLAGDAQVAGVGAGFTPTIVRVTDSSSPANPVVGVVVTFRCEVFRLSSNSSSGDGEVVTTNPGSTVLLSESETSVTSGATGVAAFQPPIAIGGTQMRITATAGETQMEFELYGVQGAPVTGAVRADGMRSERRATRVVPTY